ncbi:hypothetical protein WICPIJ_008719 [Wickerhamomyces pijperi]|uniref:Uncharacterized protein n=1 Tax=Wickerhamomyces pijperi TaxID=599730 RepID=A0A9P8THL8_WICPI|nr:hypothetical protein WICPIJ_008719 [Wickerhamomyces pijperi]
MFSISSTTAIYLRSCFLLTIAYYLIKDSTTLTEQTLIVILHQALNLKHLSLTLEFDEFLPLISLLFISLSITDLVQLSFKNHSFFESVVPVRLSLFFIIAGLSYFLKSDGFLFGNDCIFVYCLLEIWFNFLIYNLLRQEKFERNKKFEAKLEDKLLEIQQAADEKEFNNELEQVIPELERTRDL